MIEEWAFKCNQAHEKIVSKRRGKLIFRFGWHYDHFK